MIYILVGYLLAVEYDATRVGQCYAINHANKCCLARSVGAQQTIYRATRHVERYIAQGGVTRIAFGDVFYLQYIHIFLGFRFLLH